MKDFRGKHHYVISLGEMTMKGFEIVYNDISNSEDKLPVASTIVPITDSNGCTLRDKNDKALYDCCIFYETKPEDERTLDSEGKVVEPPKERKKLVI